MRTPGAVVAVAIIAVLVLAAWGWPSSDYRHNDFVGFWVGSRMLLDGVDPYDARAFRAAHEQLGSVALAMNVAGVGYGYPLTAALVFVPVALFPLGFAAPLWLVLQVIVAFAALAFLARTLLAETLPRDRPLLLAFAVASQPAWVLVAGGNVGGFLLAITATSVALLARGRPFLAGAAAGLLVVKPHPLLFAMLLLLVGLPRGPALRVLMGGVVTSGALAAASLVVRPAWIAEFLVSMNAIATAPIARASLFGALMSYGAAAGVVVAGMLLVAIVWVRRVRPPVPVLAAVAIPISLLATPYIWSYDHIVLLVTVAVVLARIAHRAPLVRTLFLALLTLAAVALPWMLYAVAFRRGDEAWSVAVPIAVLIVLALALRSPATTREPLSERYGTMPS